MEALSRLNQRADFRRNPVLTILRRLVWRIRWIFSSDLWIMKLSDGSKIQVPYGGTGAIIFYQGYSEPETIYWLSKLLKPGMVFWDIGTHIGEFSIVCARFVGENGQVHSFEPHPEMFRILINNIQLNGLSNVQLNNLAVYKNETKLEFQIHKEPSISRIASKDLLGTNRTPSEIILVNSISLDHYSRDRLLPHVIKIDVEGAELDVFRGMANLLDQKPSEAPILIFEFSESNYEQYGHQPVDLINFLSNYGYSINSFEAGRLIPIDVSNLSVKHTENNLIASKLSL